MKELFVVFSIIFVVVIFLVAWPMAISIDFPQDEYPIDEFPLGVSIYHPEAGYVSPSNDFTCHTAVCLWFGGKSDGGATYHRSDNSQKPFPGYLSRFNY
ncbi:MAG: hypothetical protein ACI83D_000097 [Planctomycetota bacterium]|jgi:hypothetical protein